MIVFKKKSFILERFMRLDLVGDERVGMFVVFNIGEYFIVFIGKYKWCY